MRRNSMDFAWNQHTRLDTNCVYRNCSCSRRSNDQTKTICLNPCGKVTVVAINYLVWPKSNIPINSIVSWEFYCCEGWI